MSKTILILLVVLIVSGCAKTSTPAQPLIPVKLIDQHFASFAMNGYTEDWCLLERTDTHERFTRVGVWGKPGDTFSVKP